MYTYMTDYSMSLCRAADDVSHSPNRPENNSSCSLSLSASTTSPRAASAVLLPGLENLQVAADTVCYLLSMLMASVCVFCFFNFLILNAVFLSIPRLWFPLAALLHLTTLRSWTLPSCHHWPLRPGPGPLMSSPQPPQPCPRTCQRLHPRPCSFSVVWNPYHFLLSRQTAWPLQRLLCTCSPRHAQPATTTGVFKMQT